MCENKMRTAIARALPIIALLAGIGVASPMHKAEAATTKPLQVLEGLAPHGKPRQDK